MQRGLFVCGLFVLLFLGESSGAYDFFIEAALCEKACPDEDDAHPCPPGCTCCCCSHQLRTIVPLPAAEAAVMPSARSPAPRPERAPSSADPHDILHVPKLGLL